MVGCAAQTSLIPFVNAAVFGALSVLSQSSKIDYISLFLTSFSFSLPFFQYHLRPQGGMSRRGLRAEVEKEKEVATALLTGNAARDLAEVAKRIALPEADASYILKVKRKSLPPFLLIIFFKFELQRANPSHCFGATFHFSRALTRQYVCSRANRLTCSCTMGRLVALILIDILITADTEPTQ